MKKNIADDHRNVGLIVNGDQHSLKIPTTLRKSLSLYNNKLLIFIVYDRVWG